MRESIVPLFLRPACIAHTVAILLHDYWAIYDPPSTSLLDAIHHTLLVITSKGQPPPLVHTRPRAAQSPTFQVLTPLPPVYNRPRAAPHLEPSRSAAASDAISTWIPIFYLDKEIAIAISIAVTAI